MVLATTSFGDVSLGVTRYEDLYGTITIVSGIAPKGDSCTVKIAYQWDDGLSDWETWPCPYEKPVYESWQITIQPIDGGNKKVFSGSGRSGTVTTTLPIDGYSLLFRFQYKRRQPPCAAGEDAGLAWGDRGGGMNFSINEGDPFPSDDCIAIVTSVQGNGMMEKKSSGEGRLWSSGALLEPGMVVDTTSKIRTAPGSHIVLTLPDGSSIKTGGGSELELRRDHCSSGRGFSTKLLFGKIWYAVETFVGGESEIEVETEDGAVGTRGTKFSVEAGIENDVTWTKVQVYEHSVLFTSLKTAESIIVDEGMESIITGNQAPTEPAAFELTEENAFPVLD